MSTTNKFNISAEKSLQNKIEGYNLTPEEKAKIWEIAKNREDNIKEETQDYRDNYSQRLEKAREELKARENPTPQLNYSSNMQKTEHQFASEVKYKVDQNHFATQKDYRNKANRNIDAILNKAYEENRGPQTQNQQQNQSLSQDFNQNAQRDR